MPRARKEKKPRNPKIWIGVAIGCVLIGITIFFLSPVGRATTKKVVSNIPIHAPIIVSNRPSVPDTVEILKPSDHSVSMAPVKESSPSVFDRIMDSFDRILGSAMTLIGVLVALREYKEHKKRKRATTT